MRGISRKRNPHHQRIEIDYPGTNNNSQFSFDGLWRNTKIVETTSGSITSTKQFVWCGRERCEERDSLSALAKQYFSRGQKISSTAYYYALDHLGSVREIADTSHASVSSYQFDPFGRPTLLSSSVASDIQYTGFYTHTRSGLSLTLTRSYSSMLGRWISRDVIDSYSNQFSYVSNTPTQFVDVLGMQRGSTQSPPTSSPPTTNTPNATNLGSSGLSGLMSALSKILGVVGIEQGLKSLYDLYKNAIDNVEKEKKKQDAGKKCVDDYKDAVECCEKQFKPGTLDFFVCIDKASKKFHKCLSDAGFDPTEVEYEQSYLNDMRDLLKQREADIKKQMEDYMWEHGQN
ncbi:MAG: hypothetical protein K2Y39_13855 [Candidatus Obscuribacterales bacterium]|nr:hypothetical protein [Candidatus Obscuribacterales bacterium]